MNMPKSRDIQGKMPSPKVILNAFCLVTVKVLNSYKAFYISSSPSSKRVIILASWAAQIATRGAINPLP